MSQLDSVPAASSTTAQPASADPPGVRTAAFVGAVGAILTVVAGALVALVVQPRTDVSDTRFSFPWSPDALVVVSLVFAVLHVLVLVGVVALTRSRLTGSTRAAGVGGGFAVAGTAVLTVAELASLAVRDQAMADAGAGLVGALFGVGTALSMVGFLVLGVATLRAGAWSGWGRFTPVAVGLALVALMGLVMTPALPVGVGVYGLSLVAVFTAVARYR